MIWPGVSLKLATLNKIIINSIATKPIIIVYTSGVGNGDIFIWGFLLSKTYLFWSCKDCPLRFAFYCYFLHFTDEETDSERLYNMFKFGLETCTGGI